MSRLCFLIKTLQLPSESTATASAHVWSLATQFAAHGHQVLLLHTSTSAEASSQDLANAARKVGVQYVSLGALPAPFDVPLFPSARIHVIAHKVAATLRELAPDTCIALDEPAEAAIAITLRRVGAAFERTRFAVMAALPRELARLRQDQLPASGREDIVHDYLERRAYAGADAIVSADPALADQLRGAGYLRPEAIRDVPPVHGGNGAGFNAWHALCAEPTASIAVPALPRVSICLPYYEQPQFLDEALASLAAQTVTPHEVILLDDGSRSPAALAAFAAAETRYADRGWKFLHQANAGPAAARNRMVELATGDAVLFCDTDNRFRPDMLESMTRAFASTGADCITCAFRTFSEPASASEEDRGYVFSPLGDCAELGLVENVLGDTNFLIRRSTFLNQGGFSAERLADEDWQFLLQLLRRGGRVESVPLVLFDYRRMATSRARRQGEFASAAITLAPVLAQTEEAWRRLWPHLVSAIRNPQVPQLEHRLETERLQHQADLARLQNELTVLRAALRKSRWEQVIQKSVVDNARDAERAAATARQHEADRAAALGKRLEELQRERDQAVGERDAKIQRMQATWSWQATAPMRALRRSLIDPLRRSSPPRAETPSLPTQPHFSIDRPAFWESAPAAGTIAGWCLIDRQPPRAMRVRIDGAEIPGRFDQIRKDVAQAHGLGTEAARCGFEFHYRLEVESDHEVTVEVQAPDETWHRLREGVLHTTSQPRDVHDYTAWVKNFSTLTADKAAALRARISALSPAERPLISVLMPVHNPGEQWLTRAIESVREQVYENWELCIADDTSTAAHVRPLLERYQAEDPRIRVVFRSENGHISAASNSALELVRGEFVALLDHDDELPPDALAEVALLLAANPATDVVYSDEDKIDEVGRRRSPYFKPDYLPDLLLGQNCLSHLSVYRTSLVRRVGGFRVGYEGSQDWDLALRVIDKTTAARVRHIPKVLYHWRAISGSTAVAVSAKNYSIDSARRALLDHFARRGIKAEVRPVTGDHWQVVYPLPEPPPLVSIIIPTRNAARLLRTCVGSIFARTEYPRFEILVVNNRSDDPETLELFRQLSKEDEVRVIDFDRPFNFSAINNAAARQANGSVLCFLNNDIEVITGRWLDELVSHALRPEIGAVGAMLYYPDNTIQHAGVVLGLGGVANHAFLHYPHGTDGYMNRARLAQNYSAVTAACLVVRRQVFEQVGGFNEKDLAVAFNDIDLCLRIRAAGYRNLWTPFAELYHHESASRGNDNAPEHQPRFVSEIEYMRRTWGELLDRDPAYNPNLAVNLLGWQLAWPPRA
jgi:glycosyltransferase involved in cell wall biosynthesis